MGLKMIEDDKLDASRDIVRGVFIQDVVLDDGVTFKTVGKTRKKERKEREEEEEEEEKRVDYEEA